MKRLYKHIVPIIMVLLALSFLWYKKVFIRSDARPYSRSNKIWRVINPVPYTEYFYTQQKAPSVFFTTPGFPSYTQWCHENKKLCSVLPIQQIYADMQRIWSIQFVWSVANPNKYLWLSKLLDNLSNLAPYWDYPYAFGQLLVPMAKKQISSESIEIVKQSREDAKKLAAKWEMFTCNPILIEKINTLDENNFISTVYDPIAKQQYQNPCKRYERSHYAAFNAFYFRKDANESARNYKISSFTDWSPWLAPIMAALVYWRGWNHIKSASIRYDKYISLTSRGATDDEIIIRETDESFKKAIFELQLQIITEASEDNGKVCKTSYDCLVQKWYIKKSIEKSYNDICKQWKNLDNLRCVLLWSWLQNKWITLDWTLTYPINNWFKFAWSNDYESRWIEGIN